MIYRYLALFYAFGFMGGCGGGQDTVQTGPGSSSSSTSSGSAGATAPSTPGYGITAISLTVGRAVNLTMSSSTGITYAVTPSLPAGLALDPASGTLSGTPTMTVPPSNFTLTATNDADSSAQASITLEVVDGPLLYAGPAFLTLGTPMPPLAPSGGGTIKSFSVAPALPSGISLDPVTGVVSGTPAAASGTTYHQITAVGPLASRTYGLTLNISGDAGSSATGTFRDATVTGLGYVSGSHAGVTDSAGHFDYVIGQGISFYVGAVPLGTVAVARQLITPVDLVSNGTVNTNYVVNVARFLMMLDQDGEPNNGIQISAAVTAAAATWAPIDFTTSDLPTALASDIAAARAADNGSHTLPDAATAQAQLTAAVECAYSGGFAGSLSADSAHANNDVISIAFTPDGHAMARIVELPTGATQTSSGKDGLSSKLDGTFTATFNAPRNATISGAFVGPDLLTGTYDDGNNGATPRTFKALRIGGASDAAFRYSGAYMLVPPTLNYPSGFAVLDSDTADQFVGIAYGSTDGAVYGDAFRNESSGFLLNVNVESPITGSISGSTVTASLDDQSYSGELRETTLQFGDVYDAPYFLTQGCRLN